MKLLKYLSSKNLLSPDLEQTLSVPNTSIAISDDRSLIVKSPNVIAVANLVSDFVPVLRSLKLNGVVFFNEHTPPHHISLADLETVARGQLSKNKTPMDFNLKAPKFVVDNSLSDLLKLQSVLVSPVPTVVVWQDSNLPYLANQGYGDLTDRPPLDWVGDSFNISGWAHGELSRTMDLLDRHGQLIDHEWKIHRRGYEDQVFTWRGNIQKITLGRREARITQVLQELV